jgi:hypothetical protein
MEQSWCPPSFEAFPQWILLFARAIHEIPKYVESATLESVDWNAELLGGAAPGRSTRSQLAPITLNTPTITAVVAVH